MELKNYIRIVVFCFVFMINFNPRSLLSDSSLRNFFHDFNNKTVI